MANITKKGGAAVTAQSVLYGEEFFGGISPRVLVMNTEHNGTVFRHSHDFYELVFIESGFTLHSCRGCTTVLTAGDMFVVHPSEVHSYISAYRTNLYNCLFLPSELGERRGDLMKLTGLDNDGGAMEILHVDVTERRELSLMLEKMIWERQNRADGWELSLLSQLMLFLVRYARIAKAQRLSERQNSERAAYTGYIFKILRFIEENYTSDITQSQLAFAAGLSGDYMARSFKSAMAMSPTEYLRKFRIAKAMELLTVTDMSVGEVASACGMPDMSQFSRTFRQVTGIAPSEYRKAK